MEQAPLPASGGGMRGDGQGREEQWKEEPTTVASSCRPQWQPACKPRPGQATPLYPGRGRAPPPRVRCGCPSRDRWHGLTWPRRVCWRSGWRKERDSPWLSPLPSLPSASVPGGRATRGQECNAWLDTVRSCCTQGGAGECPLSSWGVGGLEGCLCTRPGVGGAPTANQALCLPWPVLFHPFLTHF